MGDGLLQVCHPEGRLPGHGMIPKAVYSKCPPLFPSKYHHTHPETFIGSKMKAIIGEDALVSGLLSPVRLHCLPTRLLFDVLQDGGQTLRR